MLNQAAAAIPGSLIVDLSNDRFGRATWPSLFRAHKTDGQAVTRVSTVTVGGARRRGRKRPCVASPPLSSC